jgi:CubicO group peptidase (beta-lactamase class C family)
MKKIFLIIAIFPALLQAQSLEELAKQRVDFQETPGIAVAWIEDGKISFYSYGVTNLESREPVTSKTLFEIGSITKTFTCSALSYLVQKKEMDLNEKAQAYLPSSISLPEKNGKAIRIIDLATAHSGLPRMPGNFSPVNVANPYIDYTDKELTVFLNNCELKSEPGAQYEYSNLGMGLLGYILTAKKNTTYSKLIKETILSPLQMKETFISGEVKSKNLASGYMDRTPVAAWTWSNQSVLTGAGGIVSNTEDMINFLKAQLQTSDPILDAAFQDAHKERSDAGNPDMQIALGWHIRNHKYVWHNGGTGGFRSFAGFDPEKKRAIVLLTNSTAGVDDLGFHWLDDSVPLKTLTKSITLDAKVLKEYEGVYQISPTFKITITTQGSDCFLQATGQPKVSIYAEEADKFFLKVVDAKIVFGRNSEGKIEKLTLFQNGAEREGKKIQ